jgi:geranyl-CoA carboxylase alpha subunit
MSVFTAPQIRPFHTVLVANRGEIALRIFRSARALGYATVAVYSEADPWAPHVRDADRAVCLGGAAPADSYLNAAAVVRAALQSGADAIHPGYGFLAENPAFADAVAQAGLVLIGPSAQAMHDMGNKAQAKRLAMAAGLPCIPGYQGEDQSDAALVQAASKLGYPVMVKAAAGGGGRGMRLVERAGDLVAALASARSEARSAFGSDELILERALRSPRHVEIQLLADSQGHVLHLGERDCSVQRRHQKIIEEAPSPAVNPALRQRMGEAAVRGAQAIGYVGAGTMEFLLDSEGQFYFMEMNTRLQVEHAVTEAVTGLDLVAWQLRVAAGETLDLTQSDVALQGHAIEVRLTAEDVPSGFLPQSGPVLLWHNPAERLPVRVDHALQSGQAVSPFYDSMLAKLIAHGRTREEARRKLVQALRHCVVLGLPTNQGFLLDALSDPVFADGHAVHTGFVAERFGPRPAAPTLPAPTLAVAAWVALAGAWPVDVQGGWRRPALGGGTSVVLLGQGERSWQCVLKALPDAWQLQVAATHDDQAAATGFTIRHAQWLSPARNGLRLELDGALQEVWFAWQDDQLHMFHEGHHWTLERLHERRQRADTAASGSVLAPLTARVLAVAVAQGDVVVPGQKLVVLESMKMEHTLVAPSAGVVAELHVAANTQTSKGALLLRVEARP